MNSCRSFKKVTHVIFDMDGVILDTETLYTKATQNILTEFGKTYSWAVKAQLMGLHSMESAKKLVEIYNLPITPEEYYSLAQKQYLELMPSCDLMPGACNLIKHLKLNGIPIAVGTSSSKESYELKTKHHKDLFCLFNHVVTGGSDPEVKKGKPNPDIFLVCASRFPDKPSPEKCLVFEDAPNGVKAALSAGMQAIMIPDENVPPELTKEAHVVIKCLDDAPLEKFGLPSLKK
ncbi:unnamed protein product [Phyllotreta striolata]|uniref:pseudouridine 5'-phosphatase n=1 Tax=Phyllotreta striolata TaxID=444603 RepID=A0A9P0GRU3_PHYSR|nr:unnamed protein product [Phyllotreta striolata]